MAERQHREDVPAGLVGHMLHSELYIGTDGTCRQHYALGVAGCTRGVVDEFQLIEATCGVADMFGLHAFGKALVENLLALVVECLGIYRVSLSTYRCEILNVDGNVQLGHLLSIQP